MCSCGGRCCVSSLRLVLKSEIVNLCFLILYRIMSDNDVSIFEFDFPVPVLGLILQQNIPIELTEQFVSYRSSL